MHKRLSLLILCLLSFASFAAEKAMNNAQLDSLIKQLNPKAEGRPGYWQFMLEGREIYVITDEGADRIRVMTPITKADELGAEQLARLMQANFDSALDARYAIARGALWSTFIHPLATLQDAEFISAVAQTVTLAHSYGGSYSSGALTFGGGDSRQLLERKVYERILRKGQSI